MGRPAVGWVSWAWCNTQLLKVYPNTSALAHDRTRRSQGRSCDRGVTEMQGLILSWQTGITPLKSAELGSLQPAENLSQGTVGATKTISFQV